MEELHPGLWYWRAPHPEWTPEERWPQLVSSYAIEEGERLLLIDPLQVPEPLLARAEERQTAIVLTAPWHERGAQALVERFQSPVFAPTADTAQDLIAKFGISAERASEGSPDLGWLRAGGGEAHWYAAHDQLPIGALALPGRERNDLVLWFEGPRAVVAGDTLVDFGRGFEVNRWLRGGVSRDQVVAELRSLLALPVELVLPTHGEPTDRAALERALS